MISFGPRIVKMIKFKFNIKTESKNYNTSFPDNGNNYNSSISSTKIILIVFGIFCLVAVGAFIGFFSIIFNTINSMNKGNEDFSKQWKAINNLPTLKCKIYNDKPLKSPLSNSETAFYLVQVGYEQYFEYDSTRINAEIYDNKQIVENFDYNLITGYTPQTKLSVNGKLYDLNFKYLILDTLGDNKLQLNKKIVSRKEKNNSIFAPFFSSDHQTVNNLKDKHPWISSYLENINGYKNIVLKEYTFKNGDSIYIKGKIVNSKIVIFHEHQLYSPHKTESQISKEREEYNRKYQ